LTGPGRQSNEPKFWIKPFLELDDLPRLQSSWLTLWHAVMCPSHFCRVRVTSPSSQSRVRVI